MSGFLPPELSALTSSASTVATGASTVLQAIAAAVDIAKNFLTEFPAFDFLSGFDTEVDNFKNDFLATGLYGSLLWDYPLVQLLRSGSGGEPFSQFSSDLASSLLDSQDPNVPPFTSSAAMFVLVGGFPGIPGALELLKATAAGFSWWEELSESVDALQKKSDDEQLREVQEAIFQGSIKFSDNPSIQTQRGLTFKQARKNARELLSSDVVDGLTKPTVNSNPQEVLDFVNAVNAQIASSSYPDWQQISLRTIVPPLVDVADQALDPIVQALAAGRGAVSNAEALSANLSAKVNAINTAVAQITQFINLLDQLLALTGLYALFISTNNGVEDLATQLQAAEDAPFDDLNAFYFGTAFVAGGPSVAPFTNLFSTIA